MLSVCLDRPTRSDSVWRPQPRANRSVILGATHWSDPRRWPPVARTKSSTESALSRTTAALPSSASGSFGAYWVTIVWLTITPTTPTMKDNTSTAKSRMRRKLDGDVRRSCSQGEAAVESVAQESRAELRAELRARLLSRVDERRVVVLLLSEEEHAEQDEQRAAEDAPHADALRRPRRQRDPRRRDAEPAEDEDEHDADAEPPVLLQPPHPLLLVPQQQLPPLVVRVVVVREDERADPLEEDDDEDRGEEQKDEEVHQALGRRRAPRHAPDQPAREVQVRLDVLAPLDRILELPALPVQLAEDPVPEPLRVRRDALRRLELSEAALGAVGRGAEEVLA